MPPPFHHPRPLLETTMSIGNYDRDAEIARLKKDWAENPRWKGVTRPYSAEDVVRLRGSIKVENTIANAVRKNCGRW